eukprot:gene12818-biopygen8189
MAHGTPWGSLITSQHGTLSTAGPPITSQHGTRGAPGVAHSIAAWHMEHPGTLITSQHGAGNAPGACSDITVVLIQAR